MTSRASAKTVKRRAPKKSRSVSPWNKFKARTDSIAKICAYVSAGESLNSFCRTKGFAYVTVLDWINSDAARAENYAHAREAREETVFDSLDDVSSEAVGAKTAVAVAGLRLKADTIKWKLARMSPKKYGDKVAIGGAEDLPPIQTTTLTPTQRAARIATILANAAKAKQGVERG